MDKMTLAYAMDVLMDFMSPLQPYMEDPLVQEIKVNHGSNVWIEKQGSSFHATDVAMDDIAVSGAINTLANINSKNNPGKILDCRLPGLRIAAAQHPIAIHGSALCIRKHARSNMRLSNYLERDIFKVLPPEAAREMQYLADKPSYEDIRKGGVSLFEFLRWMVRSRRNVLISGSTSSGKTTLLNALLAEIPETERVITIEDTAELLIALLDYVGFETGDGISIRDLVRLTLRFAPKRIIVGECRGAEAYDLMAALNTGHEGGFVTFHADSSFQALPRLEGMVRQSEEGKNWPLADLRQQIASTFHYVIHAAHDYGVRGPIEIREMLGADGGVYRTRLLYSKVLKEEHLYA